MKGLHTLIKIRKKELDEIRSQIGQLLVKQESFEHAKDIIAENLAVQTEFATNYPEMDFAFGPFYAKCTLAIEGFNMEIRKIENEVLKLRDILAGHFSELKRFEIVLENRLRIEEEELKKEETKILDEVGLRKFLNNDN